MSAGSINQALKRTKKAVAITVCTSLILTTPGLPAYQVFAAKVVLPQAVGKGSVGGVAGVPVMAVPGINASLGAIAPVIDAGGAVLPTVNAVPNAVVDPSVRVSQNAVVPVIRPETVKVAAEGGAQGAVGRAILKRADEAPAAPRGIFNILVHSLRGDPKDGAPGEKKFLTPSEQTLGSAAKSKSWGAQSFDVLRGAVTGRRYAETGTVNAVPSGAVTPLQRGLRPSTEAAGEKKKTVVPGAAPASKMGMMFGGAALLGLGAIPLADISLSGAWSQVSGFFSTINIFSGLSWPALIAVQVALGLTMHFGKKWWKRRSAKKKDELERKEALVDQHPVNLDPSGAVAAVEAAARSRKAKVQIFNFVTTEYHDVELTAEIRLGVRDGAYRVSTDDTGTLYLVPRVSGAEVANEAKEDPAPPEEKPGDEARAPPGDSAKLPPDEGEASIPDPKANSPHLHEGFFGFRGVRGLKHDSSLGRLSDGADAAEIISHISRQFNISHSRLMAMAEDYGLSMTSDRAAWLAVYDRLQKMNREEFKQLDQKKYQGGLLSETVSRLFVRLGWKKEISKAGFRKLINREYPEGLRGAFVRAIELHKHFIGLFVRFPYHLFDMFFFGYFRRNISFEFIHGTEDFITLRARIAREEMEKKGELTEEEEILMPSAEKWVKGAMAHYQRKGVGMGGKFYANRGARLLRRYLIVPVLGPLTQFIYKRMTLAVFSAVAMGLIAGVLPLPLLSFHLSAVPFLGPALVTFGHGLPMFLSDVPFVGAPLAAMTGNALNALIEDMSVGALLNTFALSTMLTFPAVAKQRLMDQRGLAHQIPPIFSADFVMGVAGTAISWQFWSQNLKSMGGLMMIGAEIEGIMTYAGQIDGFFSEVTRPVFGFEFKVFHTIAAAVERPEGDSPIPFGGAITWGNILIYKLQNAAHFNITDATYNFVHHAFHGIRGIDPDDAIEMAMAQPNTAMSGVFTGQSVVAGIVGMTARGGGPEGFKPGTKTEMAARMKQARDSSGDLEREIARVERRIAELEASLGLKTTELKRLKELSKPLTEAEKKEYEEALKKLSAKRDEDYIQSKLSEIFDLKNPTEPLSEGVPHPDAVGGRPTEPLSEGVPHPDAVGGRPADDPASRKEYEAKRIRALTELEAYYSSLVAPVNQTTGYQESLGLKKAVLESLAAAVEKFQKGTTERRREIGSASTVDREIEKRLEAMVTEIEGLRGEVKGELTNRDALAKLLGVINRSRNTALKDRRDGKEMLEFHKNLAKLATVMDLALSLNEISAAQAAIKQMEEMLDRKLEKIRTAREQADRDRQVAQDNLGRNGEWEQDVKDKIANSKQSFDDMQELEEMTRKAGERIGAFRSELNALLGRIDAEDAGASVDAIAEYKRRVALLPTLVEWYTKGKPGDEDFKSLKQLNEKLADVEKYILDVDAGLDKIASVPVEFAGVLVIAVPGVPDINVTNPTGAQTLQILADRKAHWQEELASFTKTRDELRNRLSAAYAGLDADDFGDSYPLSLSKRLAQAHSDVSKHSGDARAKLTLMDSEAAKINQAVPGANLPVLSGMSLDQLKDAITDYKEQLKTLAFPNDTSSETHDAKMSLMKVATLLPQAARDVVLWAKADAQIEPIQDALVSPLPQALSVYEQVVDVINDLIADIDKDVADVNADFPNKQALIDRKKALLEKARPIIVEAREMITKHAIPYQRDTIETFSPKGDKYAKLFDSQIELYEGTQEAINRTLPWALAASGAKDGDVAGGMANIQKQRDRYLDLLNGYDDDAGHHDGINEHLDSVARRKDPNNNETEEIYGRVQPFSLPKAISQNQAEKVKRAQQVNAKHAEINDILDRIDGMTDGKFNLARLKLPTDIGPTGQASVDKVRKLVDDEAYFALGDLLTSIGNEYKDLGSPDLEDETDEGVVPTGVQPTPDVDNNTKIALLALEAAKRLVPSTNQAGNVDDGSAVYAVAEYLFADGFIDAASKNLYERIPVAEVFLNQAKAGLLNAIEDLKKDESYVQSDGKSETSDQVVDRKLAIYGELNAITRAGVEFYGLKVTWDTDGLDTVKSVQDFYDAQRKLNEKADTAGQSEYDAIMKIKDALRKTFDDLEEQRQKLVRWMSQLNPKEESALRRVAEDLRELQEKTRAVLEQNVRYHDIKARYDRANESLDYSLRRADKVQRALAQEMRALKDPGGLNPQLAKRIQDLRINGGMYMMDGVDTSGATSALVIPKKDFGRFVQTLFMGFLDRTSSSVNLAGLQQRLLQDPSALTSLIPNSEMLDFGDADGFYLVYQSQFSVPHGLESSSWVTLGNIAKVWGNNISVSGYQFVSPPNDENAPWGDKGVEVQIESLQGKNWVNYMNIDFHRFIQDIPPDTLRTTTARHSRMMVFDDFAMLLFGDKLYIGMTGFADVAVQDPGEKTKFYGGSVKTEIKFHEVVSLTAEQQQLYADDPRMFFKRMNLDFTGLDPDLNQNFDIEAHGESKEYKRTQIGPRIDLAKLLKSEDNFTVDLFWARVEGTDDYNQDSVGVNVLKGFTIKDDKGKPWMVIQNRAGYERGEKFATLSDKVSVTLPNMGVVVSAEGRLIGDAKTYFLELARKMGDHADISLSYGSRYVGHEPRLTIGMNSSFTLGELWSAVTRETADALEGSKSLKRYNKDLDEFLKTQEGPDAKKVAQLRAVYLRDIGVKLIKQDIGNITKEIQELRKAGAFMDNTRIRGMVGFTSNPVGEHLADRAAGGGVVAGTHTSLELTKTQKALIDSKIEKLYLESLRLQFRMLELTKQWQGTVVEIAQAQWELKLAGAMAGSAPTEALKREGAVRVAAAEHRLKQATIRYNMLSGRSPDETLPFTDLSANDLNELLEKIGETVAAPDRMIQILHMLDKDELAKELGDNPFNIMDWIPWVDKMTLSFGAQMQDYMANQIIGAGITLRLPVYDPASKEYDKAYVLDAAATVKEIESVWREYSLRAAKEKQEARAWYDDADNLAPYVAQAHQALGDAIRAYRNGLIGEKRLREAFDQWRWYVGGFVESGSNGLLADWWRALDGSFGVPPAGSRDPLRLGSFQQAFDITLKNSTSLDEVALREQAAARRTEAHDHRIRKFYVDLYAGYNFTSEGVGWLPSIGVTGLAVTPVLTFELKPDELRELQVKEGKGEEKYFSQFKTKLEADLALDIYRHVTAYDSAERSILLLENDILPELRIKLGKALEETAGGDPEGKVPFARRELDRATRRLFMARQMADQSHTTLNYLLGRPEDAPLDIALTPERALNDLRTILDGKDPVAADKAILDSRVEVARAVEQRVDKNLNLQMLRAEPVSLVVRSLSRLIIALSDEGLGNPERVAAARVQTLEAERAREAYDSRREVLYRQMSAELNAAVSARERLAGRTDPDSRLNVIELDNKIFIMKANLARLGRPSVGGEQAGPRGTLPTSYRDLTDRVLDAEQTLSYAGREAELEAFEPEIMRTFSSGNLRYFNARQSLGGDPIGERYADTWVEVRLRDPGTPPEVLLALAQLRVDKANRIHKNLNAASRSQGRVMLSEFETNVRLLRWADSVGTDPRSASFSENLAQFKFDLKNQLDIQADRIKALLGLPPVTTAGELMRLVPADGDGASGDLGRIAARFVAEVEAFNIEQLRQSLFNGGIPASLGSEDGLINQIRADVIAEQMSYNGFTPVGAFGIFRAHPVQGIFMEAPDPRSIQRGLERVLSDSLRKELLSQGRMQALAENLHLLMSSVSEKAKMVERQHALIRAAERDYQSATARFERGLIGSAELASSRRKLVDSLKEFSQTIAELKNDFIRLVTELEAIGYPAAKLITPAARSLGFDDPKTEMTAPERMLAYASRRVLDKGFSEQLLGKLGDMRGLPDEAAADLREAGRVYRLIEENAEAVRYHTEINAKDKLELLSGLDLEGRRLRVEEVLKKIYTTLAPDKAGRSELVEFLMTDVESNIARAGHGVQKDLDLALSMRAAYADSLDVSFDVRGAIARLEKLHRAHLEARQTLLEDYMLDLKGPADFIMRDIALDRYLKAQTAYDAEVLKTFEHKSVAGNEKTIRSLANLYPPLESIGRARSMLRFGRAMPALDALIMLEEGRVAALRFEGAPAGELGRVLAALDTLKAMRLRWQARDPQGLEPLYATTRVDDQGRRLWTTDGWLTHEDFKLLRGSNQIFEENGKLFMYEVKDGARIKLEVIGGVDVAAGARDRARGELAGNGARLRLYEIFQQHEFGLVRLDGARVQGFSYDDALAIGAKGAMFHFAKGAGGALDAGDLHAARHPLKALWTSPADTETVLYLGDKSYSRDRFPTIESLFDHVDSLRRSGRAEDLREAENFYFLETGPKGVEKLIANAHEHGLRSMRRGWMGVKLQSYGFAVEKGQSPDALYRTQDDFDAAVKSLDDSARIFAETRTVLEKAKVEENAAREKMDAQKARLDEEAAEYQRVQKDVRAQIEADMKESYRRRDGESKEAFDARFKAELSARVVKDGRYVKIQKSHGEELDKFNKLHEDFLSKYRKADRALEDLTQAGLLVARSGRWESHGEAYLKALRAAGVPGKIDPARPDKLSVEGEAAKLSQVRRWRLYVARDTALTVDAEKNLVGLSAKPVFGDDPLSVELGAAKGETRTIRGEVFAAVMDTDQTLVQLYMDPEVVDQAAENWAIADQKMLLAHEDPAKAHRKILEDRGDGKTVDPNYRMKYFVDPKSELPVLLGRRYPIESLVKVLREKAGGETWSYGPWNWGNILMEIPRGVVGTPLELLLGRDPNQEGYLGRVHMKKIEGGATNHHGLFRKALGVIDFFNFMPDPVDWYFDAGQFPDKVRVDSKIKPGENLYDKDSRAGDKDIHFGRQHIKRTVVYRVEDLVNAGNLARSYFEGGFEDVWLEIRRGRDQSFTTSRVTEHPGRDALEEALDDPLIGAHPNSDGSGRVKLGGVPGHIEVDRIERHVQIRPGAAQYAKIEEHLSKLPGRLEDDLRGARDARPGLEEDLAGRENALRDSVNHRRGVSAEERELWDDFQGINWRVGRQRAIEEAITRLEREIKDIQDELRRLRDYLDELRRRRDNPDDPDDPDDPQRPGDPAKWWPWIIFVSIFLALIAAVWDWLTRRRPRVPAPPPEEPKPLPPAPAVN